MPFGAFCPLPLRLGGTATEGVSAAQFARLSADLTASRRTRPLARITYTQGTSATILTYRGVNGCGLAHAPAISTGGTGQNTITFDASYPDPREQAQAISVRAARATVYGSTPHWVYLQCGGGRSFTVTVETLAGVAADVTLTISIYGTIGEDTEIEDYGGAPDKEETTAERTPYAWIWYLEYGGMLGSAFTENRTGYVHALKLAKARLRGAGLQRAMERFENNSIPSTSSDLLDTWARCCGAQFGSDVREWETRQDCAAKIRLLSGTAPAHIDAAVSELLGDMLVQVHRNDSNDLSDPPTTTIWPGGSDTGDASYSLCGYQWNSARAHVWVEVTWPAELSKPRFLHLMDVRLFRLLDVALPAHATFGWTTSDGFILGVSLLGYDAL